jgi:hypothetical protein
MPLTTTAEALAVAKPDYTPQLITGAFAICGALLGVTVGFFLQRWAKTFDERKRLRAEFDGLRTGIVFESLLNNLGPRLFQLKKFMTDNPAVLHQNESARDFLMKWLAGNPAIDMNLQAANLWTKESHKEMLADLMKVKL